MPGHAVNLFYDSVIHTFTWLCEEKEPQLGLFHIAPTWAIALGG